MLTAKQKELLSFINERVSETGVPPSFDEMKEALDLRSKSGIHRLITALEERGFIRRLPHRARALEIVKLPDAMQPDALRQNPLAFRSVSGQSGNQATSERRRGALPANFLPAHLPGQGGSVPVMGRIAAGVPIEAIENHRADADVPPDLLGSGEHFALEVQGDSMIEAGIHDGDVVIIERTDYAESGDIVVALIENEEATLKRLRKRGGSIELEAANPRYETRVFQPDQVAVQGKLVSLMRRYR